MIRLFQSPAKPLAADSARNCLRFLRYGVVLACVIALIQASVLTPFQIPTGSMAPTLRGRHRICVCPRCRHDVVVGRASADVEGSGKPCYYRKVCCPNCGLFPVSIANTVEMEGNRILVNKASFVVRSPKRWEIVVLRLLGTFYIKRLLGLPGEEILIQDGDLYANGQLVRKTLEQARTMRMLVFDQNHAPPPDGWKCRWESGPHGACGASSVDLPQRILELDGRVTPSSLTYRNYSLDTGKCEVLRDEYSYNAGLHPNSECVHDFMVETEIEIPIDDGASEQSPRRKSKDSSVLSVSLRLCDGHDWVEVSLPVGKQLPAEGYTRTACDAKAKKTLVTSQKAIKLEPGRRYHVEMAFVDRRLSLALDGTLLICADLPAVSHRKGVERPFQVQADGVQAILHRFHLYRDLHYGQQGCNGVHGKAVRLGKDQYFVLGDNSPNSVDSRFWPDLGRVPARCLTGSVWLTQGSNPLRWSP